MINSIKITNLRNAEYIQFTKGILGIVLSNDPVALNVKTQYDDLENRRSVLEAIFITEQGSAITADITALDARRDSAVSGIGLIANACTYHFDPAIVKHAQALNRQVKQYGGGIARENYMAETAIIDNLLADLNTRPELSAAIDALGLKAWKEELAAANKAFNDAYMLRTQELGASNKDTLLEKRLEANASYYKLRDFLSSFYTIHEGAEPYKKTVNELNALIEQYNVLLAGRTANDDDGTNNEPPTPPAA